MNDTFETSDFSRLPSAPVVSVLMLAYNHEPYLDEAIEGVLRQQADFPIELLIGEDCSTDGTREIALRYGRERSDIVRIIYSALNVGARQNHRRLMHAARGEFIAFCEGDDYWTDPHKLQRQVDWLRAHPNTGAVHTDFDHVLTRGERRYRLANVQRTRWDGGEAPSGDVFETLLRGNFIQTCTLCIRTNINLELLGGCAPERSYPVSDWPLCLYIAAKWQIDYLPMSTAVYRKVPGSMMNSGREAQVRLLAACIPMIEDFCDRFAVASGGRIDALSRIYRPMLSAAMFARDEVAIQRALIWLRAHDPVFTRSWRGRLLPRLAQSQVARGILLAIQDAREWLRERREYR